MYAGRSIIFNKRYIFFIQKNMAKKLAKILGAIFLVVGLLGFFSNPIVGNMGFFHADIVHSILHIVLGLILVLCGTEAKAMLWLKIEGFAYLVLALIGFLAVSGGAVVKLLGIIEINGADNWLHIVLAIVLLLAGFAGGKKMTQAAPMNPPMTPPQQM